MDLKNLRALSTFALMGCAICFFVLSCGGNEAASGRKYLVMNLAKGGQGEGIEYSNAAGKKVVPYGLYSKGFSDTIWNYGVVMNDKGYFGIDVEGKKLFEVFPFDNGPDYPSEGLFRILDNGKIGYADAVTGKIVIQPQYTCAFQFEEGKARVALNCTTEPMGEHTEWISEEWFYIDRKGNKIEK